jgi:hypothetical protein
MMSVLEIVILLCAIGTFLSIIWSLFQEIRHTINHGTIMPKKRSIDEDFEKLNKLVYILMNLPKVSNKKIRKK